MTTFPAAQPHGQLEEIADGIYWVRGSIRMGPGVRVGRNMVVVRSGQDVTVVSAVRLSDEGEQALGKLGTIRHVVKIGQFHGLDDAYYVSRFAAQYWALPGGARPGDPKPTSELTKASVPIPDAEVFEFEHAIKKEGALLVARDGGVLVTCDAVQHWPDTSGCSVPAKLATRVMGFTRRPAQIGPPWRKKMTPKGGSLRDDFRRLAALPFEHLIGGHGAPLRGTAKADLLATIEATYP